MSLIAADIILIIHFAFVAFVLGGLASTWIGAMRHWKWVRDVRFRRAHLAAVSFVAVEALLGFMCPLTILEDTLRGATSNTGFIARWIHRVMFYQLPGWVFTLAYVSFALVALLTYRLIPPVRAPKTKKAP